MQIIRINSMRQSAVLIFKSLALVPSTRRDVPGKSFAIYLVAHVPLVFNRKQRETISCGNEDVVPEK